MLLKTIDTKGVVMKIIKIVSLIIIFVIVFSVVSGAEETQNWYLIRKGNNTPGFPPEADMIRIYRLSHLRQLLMKEQ